MRPWLCLLVAAIALAGEPAAPTPPWTVPKPAPTLIAKPDWTIPLRGGVPDVGRLREAFRAGGSIVFETEGKPITLLLDEQLLMSQQAKPIILDGMGLVTIDGQGKTRAIAKEWKTDLTVQRLRFVRCRTDKEGAAIWNVNFDGSLRVIDCAFEDCKTTAAGPDIGGGAICVRGQRPLLVSNCSFKDCDGSNGGGINTIQCDVWVIDSAFEGCDAFGVGGGADAGPTGQGGIGGAIYSDALTLQQAGWEYFIAGCLFRGNTAGDHGGAIFAYCFPNKNAGGVFWSCHFEGNRVGDKGKLQFAGCIYTQYHRQLWVGNCSFWDNAARRDGTIFRAMNGQETFINCEFGGNTPEFDGQGTGLVFKQGSPPLSVRALGRVPGPLNQQAPGAPPPVKEKKEKEKPKPLPPAPVAAKASAEARKGFDERLRTRAAVAAKAGKGPLFMLSSMKSEAALVVIDGDGCEVEVAGSRLSVAWRTLADSDRAGMAVYLARSGDPADLALAAFWLRVVGKAADAQAYEARAGDAAKEVRAAFGE